MPARLFKEAAFLAAGLSGLNQLFRYINRKKLLVVMYHGVTVNKYTPPIWTQLPLSIFRSQLTFLLRHYMPVSLQDVISSVRNSRPLPERAVLITFDDGLRNNYLNAFPVLQQLDIPAAIFLTVEKIGTRQLLWFDELFFLMQAAYRHGKSAAAILPEAINLLQTGRLWDAYLVLVEYLKHSDPTFREQVMQQLRDDLPLEHEALIDDFGLLDWDQVHIMHNSGLAGFGVHTATHRLLVELGEDDWHREIIAPRNKLQQELGSEVAAFCYPNGRPDLDFLPAHPERLRQAGYSCAFTTESGLFDSRSDNCMTIRRIAAGNDGTSAPFCFAGNTSGTMPFFRNIGRKRKAASTGVTP